MSSHGTRSITHYNHVVWTWWVHTVNPIFFIKEEKKKKKKPSH